jgi:hypothetical protein
MYPIPHGRVLEEIRSAMPDCSRAKLKRDYEIIIIINMSCITGHAALFLRGKAGVPGKQNLIYDPAGEYPDGKYRDETGYFIAPDPKQKDIIPRELYKRQEENASLENYLVFQRKDGPDIRQYSFWLTAEEDQEIRDRITGTFPKDGRGNLTDDGDMVDENGRTVGRDAMGEGVKLMCAISVRKAINDIGPFKDMPWLIRPGELGRVLDLRIKKLSLCEVEA